MEFNVACAGLGVNTIAYLILCTKKGIYFDHILFADPGKENPGTYTYREYFNEWLIANGQPSIKTLYKEDKNGDRLSLYDDSLKNISLPSIAYGFKTCSQKFKIWPVDKFLNNDESAKAHIKNGNKINLYKGIDADEEYRAIEDPNKKYKNVYPLIEANMGRFECIKIILDAGLRLPPKSSCTFCPSMKPWEIIELYENEPKEFYDAIAMERNANERLLSVKGLGRDFSWWDLIVAYKYLKLVRKHNAMGYIPEKIKRLMLKVNRSKPIDYEKLSKERNTKTCISTLFSQGIEMPCECMT